MNIISPGQFAHHGLHHNYIVCADNKRYEFDNSNATLIRFGKKPDFVFIGDSITQGYDINSYFGDTSFCVNRGIGGDVPMYISRRFQADVIQLRPKHCVLMAGVNETWVLDAHFDSAQQHAECYEKAKAYILDYIEDIIKQCKAAEQKLIACSITPIRARGECLGKDANELIVDCNAEIKRLADDNGIVFVNYHPHFCNSDGLTIKPELTVDGTHLSPKGYDLMSKILKETLAENGIEI